MEILSATGWRIGGESSGHLLNLDHAATADAIIASMRVLAALNQQGSTLHSAKQGMIKLPLTLLNVAYDAAKGIDPLAAQSNQAAVRDVEMALGDSGRVLLRKSGTEPLVRVMVEARDARQANQYAQDIANVLW